MNEPKRRGPTPEQKKYMLEELLAYHTQLIDAGFCGKVGHSYDQGFIQEDVHQNETKKLRVKR